MISYKELGVKYGKIIRETETEKTSSTKRGRSNALNKVDMIDVGHQNEVI